MSNLVKKLKEACIFSFDSQTFFLSATHMRSKLTVSLPVAQLSQVENVKEKLILMIADALGRIEKPKTKKLSSPKKGKSFKKKKAKK